MTWIILSLVFDDAISAYLKKESKSFENCENMLLLPPFRAKASSLTFLAAIVRVMSATSDCYDKYLSC